MSLFLYPVNRDNRELGLKDAPHINCPYGDMSTLQNFMCWMSSIVMDDEGCCKDSKQLQNELDDCLFHQNQVIADIKEEYSFDESYGNDLVELFEQYIKLLNFAVNGDYGLKWS